MNIWIVNHYAVPTKYYPLARPATFAKHLMSLGHTVSIFAASTVHNSTPCQNLIQDKALYKEDWVDGIHYVYVNAPSYEGNGLGRIWNMLSFPPKLPRAAKHFAKPDAIVSVSATPMACMAGLKLARKFGCKGVAEIADLWPESFVAYGFLGKKNPLLWPLYAYEKRLYAKADQLIFTMEGGRDYIIEKGWDTAHGGPVDLNKVHHINNGVDLEAFDANRAAHGCEDGDLDDPDLFKVVYCGSIRRANEVHHLVEVAEKLKERSSNVKILVWGTGTQVDEINEMIANKHLDNIVLKGFVPKVCVPAILCKSDLNIFLLADSPLYRFGLSLNKMFEYFAAGKPLLISGQHKYSLVDKYQCGSVLEQYSPDAMADEILRYANMPKEEYAACCKQARLAAQDYDFSVLTQKLSHILERSK